MNSHTVDPATDKLTPNHSVQAYIGLGSNLDNPKEHIAQALVALKKIAQTRFINCSHWYGSEAVGPGKQPDYINAVVSLTTELSAIDLLHQLQAIENQQGRQRNIRWGARTLDLDLLLYGNDILNSKTLQLPHPEIKHRNFVLYPLYDLVPELTFPDGDTLASIMSHTQSSGLYRIDHCD